MWINQFNSNVEHVSIHGNTITAKSAKSPTAVFGAKSLEECPHFEVFVKRGHDISIGLGLQKFRSQGHRIHKRIGYQFGDHFFDNLCIELSSHGSGWDGGEHTKLAKGFQNRDLVAIDVNLAD